jgi:hypothetical protein
MSRIINEVLIVNTIFTGTKGQPQAVACRIRGEVNGKTIKVAPHLFGQNLPLAGEAVYASYEEGAMRESGNYRVLTNAKVSLAPSIGEEQQAVQAAEEAHHTDVMADTDPPF